MEPLEQTCIALSEIVTAIDGYAQQGDTTTVWDSSRAFCSRLQVTLEDFMDSSPIDENFTHHKEVTLLIEAISTPLLTFYKSFRSYMSDLVYGCEPHAEKEAIYRTEVKLKDLINYHIPVMKEQVHRYLQAIDTLLLLNIIDILASPPLEIVSKDELAALQNLMQRADVISLKSLEELATLFPAATLTVERQQRCLISMRQDVEHHWEGVEMTIQGIWFDAMVSDPHDNAAVCSKTADQHKQKTHFKPPQRQLVDVSINASHTSHVSQERNTNVDTNLPLSASHAVTEIATSDYDVPAIVSSAPTGKPRMNRKQFGHLVARFGGPENTSGIQNERMSAQPQQAHALTRHRYAHVQSQEYVPSAAGSLTRSPKQINTSNNPHQRQRLTTYDEGYAALHSDTYLASLKDTELRDMSNISRSRDSQVGNDSGNSTGENFSRSQQQTQQLLYSQQRQSTTEASHFHQQDLHTYHVEYHTNHQTRSKAQETPIDDLIESSDRSRSGAQSRTDHAGTGAGSVTTCGSSDDTTDTNSVDGNDAHVSDVNRGHEDTDCCCVVM